MKFPVIFAAAALAAMPHQAWAQSEKDKAGDNGETVAAPAATVRADAAKLVGTYSLRGVMETASGLRLHPDQKCEWYLSVGSLDIYLTGIWTYRDDFVIVKFDEKPESEPDFPEIVRYKVEDVNLYPENEAGVYVRLQPRNESTEE